MIFKSIDDIVKTVNASGSHFFSEGAMQFFKSRLTQEVFGEEGRVFITSEKYGEADRHYSIRVLAKDNRDIETVRPHFATLDSAKRFARANAVELEREYQ